jgi:NADH-quinone oxidoreductase subunit I
MKIDEFNDRNVSDNGYITVQEDNYPKTSWDMFKQVLSRSVKGELFVGMKITFGIMYRALFKNEMATVQYPKEKLPIGPRYRAVHKLLRLLESGEERCIGCGLCEKICIANCIRMETKIDENSRKTVTQYTINMGRCIFCGYCAEVCPELAIVHGGRYENASEQRAHFSLKEDILTSSNGLGMQLEFDGYGSVSFDADKKIKKTPLSY